MRCKACDDLLKPADLKRFSETTKEYLDLCGKCFGAIEEDINPSTLREIDGDEDFPHEQVEHAYP